MAASGYRFPSRLLSHYGLKQLNEIAEGTGIKAADILALASSIFHLEFDPDTEVQVFSDYRQLRNRVAHGRALESELALGKAVEANNFLRNLALKIDRQVVSQYFVIEVAR